MNTDGTVDVATISTSKSVVDTSDTGVATDVVINKQMQLVKVITSTL